MGVLAKDTKINSEDLTSMIIRYFVFFDHYRTDNSTFEQNGQETLLQKEVYARQGSGENGKSSIGWIMT